MATDFWGRLELAIKATAASRGARMAELQALEMDADSFVKEGVVRFKPYAWWERNNRILWRPAYLSGNRDSLKVSCPAGILSPNEAFIFPRNSIQRLSRFADGPLTGLRIEHAHESCPKFILFIPSRLLWAPDFEKLRLDLARVGYNVEY